MNFFDAYGEEVRRTMADINRLQEYAQRMLDQQRIFANPGADILRAQLAVPQPQNGSKTISLLAACFDYALKKRLRLLRWIAEALLRLRVDGRDIVPQTVNSFAGQLI